jgi:hypothetical protein
MTAEAGLHVEVQGVEIVVTLPGTNYAVTYYRAKLALKRTRPP